MAKSVVREVKILDAVLKEDDGTEDEPTIVQFIWLQLQDVKSERVYTAVLSLDDIKDLTKMDVNELSDIKAIFYKTTKKHIPDVFVCNALRPQINNFRNKHNFPVATFSNDITELKAIARSNPALLVIANGKVIGKFPGKSIPSYNWIVKHTLKR